MLGPQGQAQAVWSKFSYQSGSMRSCRLAYNCWRSRYPPIGAEISRATSTWQRTEVRSHIRSCSQLLRRC